MTLSTREMHALLIRYFAAEKQEGLLFVAVGVAALVVSAFLLRGGGPYRGMALPLAAVALIQLGVGGGVWLRTDRQVADLSARLDRESAAYRVAETARMEKVMSGFRLYKAVEIALLAAGIGLALLFPSRDVLYSAGIGLVAQAALMLVLDLFAERRAREYLDALARLAGG